ncbi:MAG: hypothetical protein A3K19_25485 [Lentisphaerae bacterium RIFOXYB12_FULL_65_16]|nr:MAG: hypothetical protein A3K18_32585 [Lentisphaerae bacterium RIFOXYA12_64_32]OGV84847.1 MAG: hypothetical protein A3K19_25485 [Lentisphaerae bacterium RIFOXYB12_FULL_65_16]
MRPTLPALYLAAAALAASAADTEQSLLPLDSVQGIQQTWGTDSPRTLDVVTGEGNSTDGNGAVKFSAVAKDAPGNQYFGIMIPLATPVDLDASRLMFDARGDTPDTLMNFYVRCYNRGESKPAWSFSGQPFAKVGSPKRGDWLTLALQRELGANGMGWEPAVVETRKATAVDRIEFIIGTATPKGTVAASIDNLRTAPALATIAGLQAPKKLTPDTVVAQAGQARAVVLHPDSQAGRDAAAVIVQAVRNRSGVALEARPGTPADREPAQTVILLGNLDSNPALLLLYSRYLTPVDVVCPGAGGALVHTVFDPFGKGVNAIVGGGSDDAGLMKAAALFADAVGQQPQGADLVLPRLFTAQYSAEFLKRFAWAGQPPSEKRLQDGMKEAQRRLDEGAHTSLAGLLQTVANRYLLTGHSVEAKLFVAVWDLYTKSAVADPSKFGGPWGFDSDFPSSLVVPGWDVIEHDPALTDAERLQVTQAMGRWLAEAVVPKCAGAVNSSHVPFNHQTFPALGTLFAGLYFTNGCDTVEGRTWLGMADAIFKRQAGYFKPHEDCNGYQWLTNGHLFRYAMARPDFTVFENGNAKRIIDFCIGNMDNLGYQVPYGDTGSWQCWNSEMICLDIFSFVTHDPAATWAGALKRRIKNTCELSAFYRSGEGVKPDRYNGVEVWPLEPAYYESFPADGRPPLERCFDKVTFREAMDPQAAHLLLDGLSNGGHKHLDGNSLPRLTQFDRIWLADNDYFKAPVKYHNSLLVFKDGESAPIPDYCELLGAGETPRYGFSRTRMANYAGVDWDRTVVWLKPQNAFVVLDRIVPKEKARYQLRLLWHGIGAAEMSGNGMLLTQNGPSFRLDLAPGPGLTLNNDATLGENWRGYSHAEPVVRSLSAIAAVDLDAGEPYLFATALHGKPDGTVAPWQLQPVAGADGVLVQTDSGSVGIVLGPMQAWPSGLAFQSDATAIVTDDTGLTLLGGTSAKLGETALHTAAQPGCADIARPQDDLSPAKLPTREPKTMLGAGATAKPLPVAWEQRLAPERLVLTGNRGIAGTVNLGVKIQSDVPPAKQNAFNAKSPNTVEALLDGNSDNNTDTSVMFEPDKPVTVTIDLGGTCTLDQVRWYQWWAATSSKMTSYLPERVTVAISNDAFAQDTRALGEVTDPGPHPDFGAPLEYSLQAGGQAARWVRLVFTPKAGSAVYLSEVLVEGRVPEGSTVEPPAFNITRIATARLDPEQAQPSILVATREGTLLALKPDGTRQWAVPFGCQLNDVTAADLDRDGKDEIVLARQDCHVCVLDSTGKERWKQKLEFYRRPAYVNLVRTGDLDGDGVPEVIAGAENWRFYAYKADGTPLWNYESVHPSRSSAVADIDGDGKCEVLCGTHYYWFPALKGDGTKLWGYHFGPICYDVTTGSFDGDKTRGVVIGSGDGYVHYLAADGKLRMKYNTGDEVKNVLTADVDADGKDEILAGSLSHYVCCFGADGKRRWAVDLGGPISALTAVKAADGRSLVVVGTGTGRVVTLAGDGSVLAASDLGKPVVDLLTDGATLLAATDDGILRRLEIAF